MIFFASIIFFSIINFMNTFFSQNLFYCICLHFDRLFEHNYVIQQFLKISVYN